MRQDESSERLHPGLLSYCMFHPLDSLETQLLTKHCSIMFVLPKPDIA
jgi:hypothetical protein